MIHFPKRIDLIKLLPHGARMAEVGVCKGLFAFEMLNLPNLGHLYLVDAWEDLNADHNSKNLDECVKILIGHSIGGRFSIHQEHSLKAAPLFSVKPLDAVYIDAAHDYKSVLDDLRAWSKVVKPDAVIMGHDYTHNAMSKAKGWGVIEAVETFCKETNWKLWALTNEEYPSFALKRLI